MNLCISMNCTFVLTRYLNAIHNTTVNTSCAGAKQDIDVYYHWDHKDMTK